MPDSSFNLYDALANCSDRLVRFGGHAAAAGLGIKESQIDAFREEFCACVEQTFDPSERTPKIYLDGEFPFAAITLQTLAELEKAAPFGAENPRPIFAAYGVSLVGQARRVGGPADRTRAGSPIRTGTGACGVSRTGIRIRSLL